MGTVVRDTLVKEHLGTELIGHVSRDSTAIVGREKPTKKVKVHMVVKKKGWRGRDRYGRLPGRSGLMSNAPDGAEGHRPTAEGRWSRRQEKRQGVRGDLERFLASDQAFYTRLFL